MINIAIAGISGRMGQSIYRALQKTDSDMQFSVVTTLPSDTVIGKTVSEVFGGKYSVMVSDTLNDNFDVL